MDHVCTIFCITNRVLRNVCFYITKLQVVACIQHTTVSIPTSLAKVILCFFCCSDEHFRSIEMFCKKCLGDFRSEVSKIYTKCITSCFFDIFQSLNHMNFTLYDTDWTFVDVFCIIFFSISFYKSFSSVYGKAFRETVTAYSNDSNFYFWHVIHDKNSSILYSRYLFYVSFLSSRSVNSDLFNRFRHSHPSVR